MNVLVIGGSQFLGHATVNLLVQQGHAVTTFRRGRTGDHVPDAEIRYGNRNVRADLEGLCQGRTWDVVLDFCGFRRRQVNLSTAVLAGACESYLFISSVSAFADWPSMPVDEDSPLHAVTPGLTGEQLADYGLQKAECERVVLDRFGSDATILYPAIMHGPRDNVGRVPWWLWRARRGGTILAPGNPDRRIRLVDARDIASFIVHLTEEGRRGRYVTGGGAAGEISWGDLLELGRQLTGSESSVEWLEDGFLLGKGVEPWSELPLWAPDLDEVAAIWNESSQRAVDAGFRPRPVTDSIRDSWDWLEQGHAPPPRQRVGRLGISRSKERQLLRDWRSPSS